MKTELFETNLTQINQMNSKKAFLEFLELQKKRISIFKEIIKNEEKDTFKECEVAKNCIHVLGELSENQL